MNTGYSATTVALAAFVHHAAAFTVVATIAVEFALLRSALTLRSARQLQIADLVYGLAAGTVLAIGFFRVFYFEKGSAYYFQSTPFTVKLTLFAIVGLVSIYPTAVFLSWGKALKQGRVPEVSEGRLRALRSIVQWELGGLAFMMLAAALMAKGVGLR
jgi:putative membrane protein